MMYGYTFLVPINQKRLSNPSKEHNISGHNCSITYRVVTSHRSKIGIRYTVD